MNEFLMRFFKGFFDEKNGILSIFFNKKNKFFIKFSINYINYDMIIWYNSIKLYFFSSSLIFSIFSTFSSQILEFFIFIVPFFALK